MIFYLIRAGLELAERDRRRLLLWAASAEPRSSEHPLVMLLRMGLAVGGGDATRVLALLLWHLMFDPWGHAAPGASA